MSMSKLEELDLAIGKFQSKNPELIDNPDYTRIKDLSFMAIAESRTHMIIDSYNNRHLIGKIKSVTCRGEELKQLEQSGVLRVCVGHLGYVVLIDKKSGVRQTVMGQVVVTLRDGTVLDKATSFTP